MHQQWNRLVITKISLAMYVGIGVGKAVHKDRSYHGLVINDDDADKEYHFSDGQVLVTPGNSLFYLPKGSSYQVKTNRASGCYAINFAADLADEPFVIKLKNPERVRRKFRAASELWQSHAPQAQVCAMAAVYDTVAQVMQEQSEYTTQKNKDKLTPALQLLEERVMDPELSVAAMAEACGVSEVYFRKLFRSRFGETPKEYIIQKRLDYACQLLLSDQFSVGEVARMCGYTEPCNFSREFSARIGVPPNQYKG